MKKTLYIAIIFVGILSCGTLNAQSVADSVTVAKSEKEVLKLSMKRTENKKELEKARKEYAVEYEDAKKATRDADKAGDNFKSTTNFGKNERGARSAARKMKKAETANKRLARSKRNIENLEKKIRKTEEKIRKLNPQIELTEVPD